jgi:hypothetical protein
VTHRETVKEDIGLASALGIAEEHPVAAVQGIEIDTDHPLAALSRR